MATIYATLEQIKAYISEKSTSPNPGLYGDTNLERLENAAARTIDKWIESVLGRPRTFVASGDTTRTFNVLDRVIGSVLHLETDLCAVTTVLNDTVAVSASNYKLLTGSKHPSVYTQVKLLTGSWAYTTSVYPDSAASITGRFAYSTTPPADIVQACIQLTAAGWRQRHTTANVQAVTVSTDGTLVFPDGLPKSVVDLLEYYVS